MKTPKDKTVVIICGPTAVGKTPVAIALAKYFHTEIISADSRQCFKDLNIGVARPSEKELNQVKHHFVASYSIQDEITAAGFEKFALQKVTELFAKKNVVVMAGGSGLYIKVFCEGMDKIPDIDPEIRHQLTVTYKLKGIHRLQDEVKQKDPEFYKFGEIKNPQRLIRALEVLEATGKSIMVFRKGRKSERNFNILKIGLELPKEELHRNINVRVDKMIEAGLLEEVKNLLPFQHLNALQTVGYKEIFDFLKGIISLEQATSEIKKNTRKYAKRQMTWFKKDPDIKWFQPDETEKMIEFVSE